jgi:hypothetical protein
MQQDKSSFHARWEELDRVNFDLEALLAEFDRLVGSDLSENHGSKHPLEPQIEPPIPPAGKWTQALAVVDGLGGSDGK